MQDEQQLPESKPKRRLSVSKTNESFSKKRKAEDSPNVSEDTSGSESEEDLNSMDGMCRDNNCMICYKTGRSERDHMIPVNFHKVRTMESGWTIMNYLPEIIIPFHSRYAFMCTERARNITYHISEFTDHISVYHS